jgi:hypothetical protein
MKEIHDQTNLYKRYVCSLMDVWRTPDKTSLTEDEIAALIELDNTSVPNIVEIAQAVATNRPWLVYGFYRKITNRYPAKTQLWEDTTLNYDFLASRVNFAEYYSFSVFDRLSLSPNAEHRLLSIRACNEESLVRLSNDKSVKVRREAFLKLGPKALDRMLEDPKCEVRELGVMMAPIDYPKLTELTDDLSIRVIKHLVRKVDVGELPFILGNRNIKKNAEIRRTIEQRLSALGD